MNKQEQKIYMAEDEEREISLSSVFASLLRSWHVILLWGIVFCLLGAGYQMHRSQRDEEGYEKAVEEYERQFANYESAVESYEKERDAIQADIDDIYGYIDQSILLKINPYKEAFATADLMFDVKNESYSVVLSKELSVRNDEADPVLGAYTSFLDNAISYTEIAEKYGTEDRYIRELVQYKATPENGNLNISVKHTDQEAARDILDYVLDKIDEQKSTFEDNLPKHSFTIINKAVRENVDITLVTAVDELRAGTTIAYNVNSLYSKQLNKVDEYKERIATIDETMANLSAPKEIEVSTRNGIIKYGLIGLIGGLILGIIILWIHNVSGGKLLDRQPIVTHFGLPLLAAFPHGKGPFNRKADRILGAESGLSQDEVHTVAVNSIHRMAEKENNNILLAVGTEIKEKKYRALQEGLAAKDPANTYVVVPSFGNNLHTQQALDACDYVVLLAEIAKTKEDSIANMMNIAAQYDKLVMGVILYN